jgi:DNA polymerase I
MNEGRRLVLIDGHALLYRAFFAFPRSLTLPDGQLVNAAFGFTRILLSTLVELKPTHIAVSFDVGKTFRHEAYPEYKAHREKMPDELKSQEPIVQEILNDLNVPIYSMLNYEADDVIGTVARQASNNSLSDKNQASPLKRESQVIIVTGDRDMWQLVDEHIRVFIPGGGRRPSRTIDRQAAYKGLGVWPEQVPDYKGLAGDGSDNIPGVTGIGPKTAIELIAAYGSMEAIYEHVDEVRESVKQKLVRDKEIALLSKELATIKTDVELEFDWDMCKVTAYDKERATESLLKYDFKSLVAALPVDAFEEDVQEALF